MKNILVVGITGGIGSGKTTFSNLIKEKGYEVIFTDILAKEVIDRNPKVRNLLLKEFGVDVFVNGNYNSKYIADIVFDNKNKLERLNQIVFPAVIDALVNRIENLIDSRIDTDKNIKRSVKDIIFVESALLYEFELAEGFDYVVSVSSKLENRINRVKVRDNLSDTEVTKRINNQMSQEEKNKLSDFVVENDKGIIELDAVTDALLDIISILPNRKD